MRNPLTLSEKLEFERLLLDEWRREYVRILNSGILPSEMLEGPDYSAATIAACTIAQKFQPENPKLQDLLERYYDMQKHKPLSKTLIEWFRSRPAS